ncbi:TIGR01777 family oxidoreductase [Arthrobacter sp. 35W]|uniref:TIGR01777 family oxidoreductase n=1 Tax=Arthrobacter sp. 35W TaxID=1132441 RepID=UPI0004147D1F|nr:TIGR01777 family oxidoreductase [Arthrobacter sp. 35W]
MGTFRYTTRLPHPRSEVFEWFQRPGALMRLNPPFGGTVRQEPSRGIEPGSTAVLGMGAPGSAGMWLGSSAALAARTLGLPPRLRPEVLWHARHTALVPGESFTDVMASGPLGSWEHTHSFRDAGPDGTVMEDNVEYRLLPDALAGSAAASVRPARAAVALAEERFERELRRFFGYRSRTLRADLAFHHRHAGPPRTIAVAGASGLIGRQLCALLGGGGHRVIRLVRGQVRHADEVFWDPETGALDPEDLRGCDVVVNLAGATIGGRFTEANKERIRRSRIDGTTLLAEALAGLAADGVARALVCGSAVGYYGATPHGKLRNPALLTEDAPAGDDFLAAVCRDWEAACEPAARAGVRVVNVRTGLVLTPAGGLLQQLLPLYLAGVGGRLGSGEWQSWVSIDDIAGIFAHAALDDSMAGPFNGVGPEPVRAAEFASTLGSVLHRPASVPVPAFGPRLLLGAEGAHILAGASQRASSAAIEAAGYDFRHRTLPQALRHVLGH